MPATSFAIPLTSARRPSNSFLLSPHCYEGDAEQIPYRFTVIREERRESSTSTQSHSSHPLHVDCRWHLPLWLLFFGVTVSILTLLFLLTGSMYPIHGWWSRYGSESLGVLKGICRAGHSPSAIDDSVSYPLAPVSYVEPSRVFARSTRSGNFIVPSTVMRRPSTSGPAFLVDNSVRASWSPGGTAVSLVGAQRNPASNIISHCSFPCSSRSASPTYHVMRDVLSLLAFRRRDTSNPQERSYEFNCGLWQG